MWDFQQLSFHFNNLPGESAPKGVQSRQVPEIAIGIQPAYIQVGSGDPVMTKPAA
jgi:hypothetical protein